MYRLVFVFGHTTLPWIQSAWEFINSVCSSQLLESCHMRCFAWAKFIRIGENSGQRNSLQNFSWWLSLPISALSVVGLDARNAVHRAYFNVNAGTFVPGEMKNVPEDLAVRAWWNPVFFFWNSGVVGPERRSGKSFGSRNVVPAKGLLGTVHLCLPGEIKNVQEIWGTPYFFMKKTTLR